MKPPLFVRELTADDRAALRRGRRSPEAFTLRRSQVLLARAAGRRPAQVAAARGCATQTVRDAIRAFHAAGVGCRTPKSKAPKTTHPAWPRDRDDDLKALLHQSPRTFGKPTSLWTLGLVAQVCHANGGTARILSAEAIRKALLRLDVGWKRAKHWATSPGPESVKKNGAGPADRPGREEPGLGTRGPGRVPVEPARPARPVRLDGRRPAAAGPAGPGPGGRAGGVGVLRHLPLTPGGRGLGGIV